MPLPASLYILVVCTCALYTLYTDHRHGERTWFLVVNLLSIVIMLLMFTGYWIRTLVETIGLFAPALLLFSLVWEICTAYRGVGRRVDPDMRYRSARLRSLTKRLDMALEIIL